MRAEMDQGIMFDVAVCPQHLNCFADRYLICCPLLAIVHPGRSAPPLQIQALSRAFSIPIHVVQHGPPVVVSHGSAGDSFGGTLTPAQSAAQGDDVIRISYHKRMYGLGEVRESISSER